MWGFTAFLCLYIVNYYVKHLATIYNQIWVEFSLCLIFNKNFLLFKNLLLYLLDLQKLNFNIGISLKHPG